MVRVSCEALNDAYYLFCEVFGFEPSRRNSIFEFSAAIGFSAVGCWPMWLEDYAPLKLSPRTAMWVERLTGPHQRAMANVLKSKRYGFYGRLSTPIIKAWHAVRYTCLVVVQFVVGLVKVFTHDDRFA